MHKVYIKRLKQHLVTSFLKGSSPISLHSFPGGESTSRFHLHERFLTLCIEVFRRGLTLIGYLDAFSYRDTSIEAEKDINKY